MILELPQMKELPKRTLHEKGRQYSLAGRWVHVAGVSIAWERALAVSA